MAGSTAGQSITGTVSDLDEDKNTIKVKSADGQEKQFTLDTSTKFSGKWGELSDLKKGDHVTVMANGTKAMSISETAAGSSPTSGSSSSGSTSGSGARTGSGSSSGTTGGYGGSSTGSGSSGSGSTGASPRP
jgi:uncharacterized membrane protein YgcG